MAAVKLHVTIEFFKQLSLELQQLKVSLHYLETFTARAVKHGHEGGDQHLLLILDQMELFVQKAKTSWSLLEDLTCRAVTVN